MCENGFRDVHDGCGATGGSVVPNGRDEISAGKAVIAFTAQVTDGTAYGIHYSYDLGGGTSFEAGAVRNTLKDTTFQAGVYFSF